MSDSDRIEVSRIVDAHLERIFDLLADPNRHGEFDSSDMLRGPGDQCARVGKVGDEFVIKMRNERLGDYQMANRVICFEPNRRIGWAPALYPSVDAYQAKLGGMKPGGHTFTWELEPAGDGRTRLTQIYDWSQVSDEAFRGLQPMLSEEQLADSIERVGRAAQ